MAGESLNENATTRSNIFRHEFADYLETSSNTYHLMNTGFTSLGMNPNAQEETVQYVGDKNSSSEIVGYQTEFPYSTELIKEQECTLALYKTGEEQKVGSDAQFSYIRVNLFEPVEGQANTYNAKKYLVTNVVSDGPADPGKATTSGTLKQNGNYVVGTFNVSTRTFSATV